MMGYLQHYARVAGIYMHQYNIIMIIFILKTIITCVFSGMYIPWIPTQRFLQVSLFVSNFSRPYISPPNFIQSISYWSQRNMNWCWQFVSSHSNFFHCTSQYSVLVYILIEWVEHKSSGCMEEAITRSNAGWEWWLYIRIFLRKQVILNNSLVIHVNSLNDYTLKYKPISKHWIQIIWMKLTLFIR